MEKPRYFVAWSPVAVAYAVFDRLTIRPENSTGYGIIWGTDSPVKSIVQKECDLMNSGKSDFSPQEPIEANI